METGQAEADATERSQLFQIIADTKTTPQECKKAKRSIVLSKRSHLEVITDDWQHEVYRSSIPDFKPSRTLITELAQNQTAAVVNCPTTV